MSFRMMPRCAFSGLWKCCLYIRGVLPTWCETILAQIPDKETKAFAKDLKTINTAPSEQKGKESM